MPVHPGAEDDSNEEEEENEQSLKRKNEDDHEISKKSCTKKVIEYIEDLEDKPSEEEANETAVQSSGILV